MSEQHDEDGTLEETLRKQKDLLDYYKGAAKRSPDKRCKELYKHLQSALTDQVGDVASELARHRMERDLGRPLDHK
ncbi:MAG: hypothetical protein M3281_08595 [Chloroflexota bacterium]|nr:hypothetical protein [Chloroflexota bacterium]